MNARLALLLPLSLSLAAQDKPSFSVVNDAIYQNNKRAFDESKGESEGQTPGHNQFLEQLTLGMNWGALSASLTGRANNYYKGEPDQMLEKTSTDLYKINLKYSRDGYTLQGGDFNAVLGKGLVLSVVQNDAVLNDLGIRGGDFYFRSDNVDYRILAGEVTNHLDKLHDPKVDATKFKKWRIAGGELNFNALKGNWVGVRASRIEAVNMLDMSVVMNPTPRDRKETIAGALFGTGFFGGVLDYHVEVADMRHRDLEIIDPAIKKGEARFANLSLHPGRWMFALEHKEYKNFEHELNNPPLADRETEQVGKTDSMGTRLLVQYLFPMDLTVFGNYGLYEEGAPLQSERNKGYGYYFGFKLEDLFDCLSINANYGAKNVHPHENVKFLEKKSEAYVTYTFAPRWSLELNYHGKDTAKSDLLDAHNDWTAGLQLAYAPIGSIYVNQQYHSFTKHYLNTFDTNKVVNGGVRIALWKGGFLDISGGKVMGGKVCSGGQCRIVPAFEGWKVVTSMRF